MRAAAVLATLALACGDTLVDHAGTAYFSPSGAGLACEAPLHACGGACVAEDVSSCGPACAACTAAPQGAVPVCASHACAFECTGGLLRCGDACCGATAVAAGARHTCAVTSAGGVKCWGANDAGQLGAGLASAAETVPVDVAALSGAVAVATGASHTCAIAGGAVHCWGANGSGQLGDGTSTDSRTPVAVTLPGTATSVAAGERHTCAVARGAVYCWGDGTSGQLGTPASSATPVAVPVGTASAVAAGALHSCAVLAANGGIACWGANDSGQAGTGSFSAVQATPFTVGSIAGALALAAGGAHTCAVVGPTGSSTLWCWGSDADLQLGISTGGSFPAATQISLAPTPTAAVAAGRAHTCALKGQTGDMKCFGADASGQLGAPGVSKTDVVITFTGSAPSQVAAGGDHTCTLFADGAVACWGSNASGELGDGTTADRAAPAPVSGR